MALMRQFRPKDINKVGKYRIVEWMGVFKIEVKVDAIKKGLFKTQTISEWYPASTVGGPCMGEGLQFSCKSFTTLKEAEEMIIAWRKEPVLYYY